MNIADEFDIEKFIKVNKSGFFDDQERYIFEMIIIFP